MNLASLVRSNAVRSPHTPAFIERHHRLTYGELVRRADAAAVRLRDAGVQRGDRVAIGVVAGWQHMVLLLAASRLGAATCTLDRQLRAAEREAILAAISPHLLVVDRPVAAGGACPSIVVDDAWLQAPAEPAEFADADDPDLPAILLLTSGSTGVPKVMVLSQQAAIWRARVRNVTFGVDAGTRLLTPFSPAATAGIQVLLGQLVAGGTAYQFSALHSPEELMETLVEERIGHAMVSPTTARWMLERAPGPGNMLPDVHHLLVTAAAFHPDEARAFMERVCPNLYISYGASGAGGIAVAGPAEILAHPTSVGRPWPRVEVEIVDEQDRPLPTGASGRIRIRSPGAASGYWGDTGATATDEAFRDGWVYPGDVGRLNADSFLFLEGRASSVIIRGGQNIYPEEVERVLSEHEAVADACVVGRTDPLLGEVPVAFLVLRTPVSDLEIKTFCVARLSAHKVPSQLVLLDALPRTAAGKTDRAALAAGRWPGTA